MFSLRYKNFFATLTLSLSITLIALILFFLFMPRPTAAEAPLNTTINEATGRMTVDPSPSNTGADLRQLQKLGNVNVQTIIANGIKALLGVAGAIALLMFVYGGFLWMIAAGNEEQIKKGKNTLLWASIGIVAMFLSYAGVKFVFSVINMEAVPAQDCTNFTNPDGSIEIRCKGDPKPKK